MLCEPHLLLVSLNLAKFQKYNVRICECLSVQVSCHVNINWDCVSPVSIVYAC